MKKTFILLFFFISIACLHAQNFTWDVKFLAGRMHEAIPISQIIRMETGDGFEFSITPQANAHCYIVCYDSQRQIIIIHDQQLTTGEEKLFGPFKLTEPGGTETIYIIMSSERQTALESLILTFNNNPGSRQHANNLYREVVRLQNSVSRLGEPASLYIPSGGTTRGNTQPHITRFSGRNLYVRTITIRH